MIFTSHEHITALARCVFTDRAWSPRTHNDAQGEFDVPAYTSWLQQQTRPLLLTFEGLRQVRDESAMERMTLMLRTAKIVRPDLPRLVYDILRCEPRETRTDVPGHPSKMRDRIESRLNDPDECALLDLMDGYALDFYVQGLPRKDDASLPDEDRTAAWFEECVNVNADLLEPLRPRVRVMLCQHQCYHAGHGLPWGIRMSVPMWRRVLKIGRSRFEDLVWWTGPEEKGPERTLVRPSAHVLRHHTAAVKEVWT